ncbi:MULTISPECIES: hypothetical protein [Sphingomonas]|jgi:hypothetical protein|uniref:Uncharacterized protein n=1 Tax=Sphingomonas zeae TaxID=1646122 RepID=A0A7Y6B177_9SPHN|nr:MULTISPECIES: hypothetical protein [Sphingomonas]MBB4050362.1 hypothetical protein [Sphingomonas zeae]NUU45393.1 hypothetical protein [Sphingomonas zeae]
MQERDPNIVNSGLSRTVTVQGARVEVMIYRLEHDPQWALEVVNENGTSTVWDNLFDTDEEASEAFELTLREEGIDAFLDRSNVIEFPRR